MHIEIQMALNFIISCLYNKLPRRRVNIFGEELDKALKEKFRGHWYPDKPFKGSAYRCLKIDATDAVLNKAARESGLDIFDILEHLPQDVAIWIDPGEVSYRIGEKGPVKILFSEIENFIEDYFADREFIMAFNPEAQYFWPIEPYGTYYGGYPMFPMNEPFSPYPFQPMSFFPNSMNGFYGSSASMAPAGSAPTQFGTSAAPFATFLPRNTTPLTFTTATFAQTKFGSTKLKNSGKRANRMSPAEFSNYIKQRALQQQMNRQYAMQNSFAGRTLPPNGQNYQGPPDNYYFQQGQTQFQPQFAQQNIFDNSQYTPDMYNRYAGWENMYPQYAPPQQNQQNNPFNGNPNNLKDQHDNNQQLFDGMNNYGPETPYTPNQYQHLLIAN